MANADRRAMLRLGTVAALSPRTGVASPRPEGRLCLSISDFGARGDGGGDNSVPLEQAFAASLSTGLPLHLPPGRYRVARPVTLDVAPVRWQGFTLAGSGRQTTILDFSDVASSEPALTIRCTSSPGDAFYSVVADLGIVGRSDGPTLQVGKDDFSDAHNSYELRRLTINNGRSDGNPVGLRLNNVLNSVVDAVVNCQRRQSGVALQLRRAQFCTFTGAQGHAAIGLQLGGSYNYGNVFLAPDYEELGTAIQVIDPHATRNTWIGGTVADAGHAFDFRAGIGNKIINMNIALAQTDIALAQQGLSLDLPEAPPFSTPELPPSGVPVTNTSARTIRLSVLGGSVQSISIEGQIVADQAVACLLLCPGESVMLRYARPPSWTWLAL